ISGNVIPIDTNVDARLNNVQGYLKYGRYIWGESFKEPPQPQPPQEMEPVEEPLEESISEALEEIDEPIDDIDDFVEDEFPEE
ncbi:MAG: hypothetical protein JRD71_06595, partial [Deltaproteobacteria bacterium]|nr:hypothetical protein [Deltaproteobacteria bacterium]